jgi:nitrite reductase/ring-hydroxylating ferredoxin subunit
MSEPAWVAVGGSAGLAPGAVMPAIVRQTEIVVWRGPDGAVHAWRNQCPHRGMRLSFGYVDGDGRLACRYHGWRYGADGKCAAIPAHPDRPPPDDVSVTAFASRERDTLIWVALSDAPPLGAIGAPGEKLVFCRSLVVRAGVETVIDAAQALEVAPGVVRTESPGAPGVLALQPVDARRTGIHLVAVADGGDEIERRLELTAWGRALRQRIEATASPDV